MFGDHRRAIELQLWSMDASTAMLYVCMYLCMYVSMYLELELQFAVGNWTRIAQ